MHEIAIEMLHYIKSYGSCAKNQDYRFLYILQIEAPKKGTVKNFPEGN